MCGTCSRHRRDTKYIQNFGPKTGKEGLGVNGMIIGSIKMNLKQTGYYVVD